MKKIKNKSIWSEYLKKEYSKLNKDLKTDILIVGGGLSGILTAFYLNNSNLNVTLVERNIIGSGTTSKMTGKITILQDILVKIEESKREKYLKSQIEGLNLLKKNIEEYNLKCDFEENISYLYTTKKNNINKIKKITKILDNLKISYTKDELDLKKLNSLSSIKTKSYIFNPILYLKSLKKECNNINIYEDTNIVKVSKKDDYFLAETIDDKKIIAKKIVFASAYPYFLKPLFFPIKVRNEKSYIGYGKYKNISNNNFNSINIDKNVTSIRFYHDKMIYLGLSKIIANKVSDKMCFSKLLNNPFIDNFEYLWSNIDLITNDYLPIVGEVLKDMYIITGFNTWGILNSHVGAKLISDLILKNKNKYQELFLPRRKITLKKLVNSSINIFENINGFIKGFLYQEKGVFYTSKKAIYFEKDKYYVVNRKCPHLKCNLIFNEIEKTWDCPCHGSRFDLKGNVITGPSKFDVK